MNNEAIKAHWQLMKSRIKARWGRLTDDDLARIEEDARHAEGLIQERYNFTKDDAKVEWDEFCQQWKETG